MILISKFFGDRLIHSLESGEVKVYFFPRKDNREDMSFGKVIGKVKLKSELEIFESNGSYYLMKK